ncbi:heparinase [Sphingobacterium sp. SGG-5]|uniref:heparinase II/III domain-containing protein n=1 Tax=Sphingobacterium sp. SGG-5 TaxID=2710881 RepID=UPI0013EB6AC6|nr:heparinase II/III family protein [Sphingobacterium sp. SGG-5]NGM61057.1 heparinase [Sphingobacterium sp. SGG-5]
MMRKNIQITFLFFICCLTLLSCKKNVDHTDSVKVIKNGPSRPDDENTSTEFFDYSQLRAHPRLLFTEADEPALKDLVLQHSDLAIIYRHILNFSNTTLNEAPVERVLEGKRLLAVSRTALKRIFYLSFAYRMTDDSRYLDRAETEINAVCDFSDWNPSHFLDIGEMAAGVAIGYDWLYADLTEATKIKIRRSLREKAFEPSNNSSQAWFLSDGGNWNQVCNGGLVLAALAIYEDNEDGSAAIIERAYESVKLPLAKYSPSGSYTEGYSYWGYGTTYQVMMMAALESALGTDGGLHSSTGFMQTADYITYMTGSVGLCFNYADCAKAEVPNPVLFWFAKKANNPSLVINERKLMQGGGRYIRSFSEDRLMPLALIFGIDHDFGQVPASPTDKLYVGYGEVPVAVVKAGRDGAVAKYVGIKGGAAGSAHGHMDAGSFVFEMDGVRWAIDLGLQSYITLESKGVDLWNMGQSSQRWDVLRINNHFHNTLTINGNRHLVNGKAEIKQVFDTDAKRGVLLDLTPVFKNDLEHAEREITLMNEDYLAVTDELRTNNNPATLRWSMVTNAEPEIVDSHTLRLHQDNKIIDIQIESSLSVQAKTWSTEPITDYDAANPGTVVVGFEGVLPANQSYVFQVKMGVNLN